MQKLAKFVLGFMLLALSALPAFADAKSVAYTPEVFAEAQATGKMIVVDVYADWCLTCQARSRSCPS